MALKALTFTAFAVGIGAVVTVGMASFRAAAAERAYPPIGEFVDVEGGRVHYLQEGSGPHLVLIHGAGGNLRDFKLNLMDQLSDRYTVTAFDRPGLGYSSRVPDVPKGLLATEGDPPMAQAAMLREAAEKIGITDPIVVGHSFGGIVSYAWALHGLDQNSPANAAAIVSLAGVTMPWPGDLDRYYTVNGSAIGSLLTIPLISAFVPQSVVAQSIDATFAPQSAPEGYGDFIGAGLTLRPESMRANIRQVNTLRPHVVEMAKRYPELTLPIEIVHGEDDLTVPIHIHAEEIAKIVPQVNLTRLPGVGHMPHHSDADATIAAINRAASEADVAK